MRILLALGTAVLGLVCTSASAQSSEVEISAWLMGKPLLLRGCWAADDLTFNGDGEPNADYGAVPFTVAAFNAQKVTLRGDKLTIQGQRVGLSFDKDGTVKRIQLGKDGIFKKSPEKMTIEIDGHGDQNFNRSLDAIFASSLAGITPTLPRYWQRYARKQFLHVEEQPDTKGRAAEDKPLHIAGSIKPPKVLHTVDPSFSNAARSQKFSGNVLVYLVVDQEGVPEDVSVLKPAGLGLDEQAVAAVEQYRFQPATRNGEPVKVDLSVEVNFQIF